MRVEDIQQSRIRTVTFTKCQPRLRRSIRAYQNVHHPDEFCKRLGRRVPPTGCDQYTMLDRSAFEWTFTMARSGSHTNGIAGWPDHVSKLDRIHTQKSMERKKYT